MKTKIKKTTHPTVLKRIEEEQREWIKAFKELWTVAGASKKIGMDRTVYYSWIKKYPKFREEVKKIKKEQVEYVESKLYQAIKEGNLTAIIFYLKCRSPKWRPSEKRSIEGKIQTTTNEQKPLTPEELKEIEKIDAILKEHYYGNNGSRKKFNRMDKEKGNKE